MDFYKDGKKRVLIFSLAYTPFVGGAELAVKEITDRINDLDFDLITLRFNKNWPKKEKIGNVNVYRIGGGKLLFPFFAFCKARKLHKKNGYSLAWSLMANRAGFAALFFKTFFPKVKFLLTLQEGDASDYPEKRMGIFKIILAPFFRKIFTKADYIQAISNYLADWARKMGAKGTIDVVPNGTYTENRHRKSVLKPTYDVGSKKIIITTSRLVHKNGIDTLIKAISNLKHQISNFELWILGSGAQKYVYDLAKKLAVEDRVKIFGHIEPEKISEYLTQADVFARPSRSEGLGSSFLEAMGAGLPVIGTPVGGIPDFLQDNETGLFCKVDNPQDLAEKIKLLITDERLAKRIAENGRRLVLEKYNWDNIARRMKKMLSHIITIAKMCDSKNFQLKILICTGIYPPDGGGPATYSKLLFDELSKRGMEVNVLSFGEVRSLPKILRHGVYFFKALKRARKADIVYAQDPVSVGLPAMLAAKILRKKFLLKIVGDYAWEQFQNKISKIKSKNENSKFKTLENFQIEKFDFVTELRRKTQKYVAKKAEKIIVPSNYLKNIVLKWGIGEEKIKVIYNAFDAPFLKKTKEELRKKFGLLGTVLISAGRLVPWKGFDALIEIMPEIIKEIPDIKLYIIGSGPEEKNLKFQISNFKIEDKVFLMGQLPHEETLMYLKAGDIFVLNTGYEGFSHFLLEAMAMGIPIITTNVGGNAELIENGKEGILIEYNNKEELKKKIIELAGNETLREKLKKEAKNKVAEFGQERMLESTIKNLCEFSI